jgi:DtxR family transcriptional regulator, manganese transport regulator
VSPAEDIAIDTAGPGLERITQTPAGRPTAPPQPDVADARSRWSGRNSHVSLGRICGPAPHMRQWPCMLGLAIVRTMAGKQPALDSRSAGSRRAPISSVRGYKRTRQDHARELAEDYVELIDELIRETGEARAVDVAARLGVTHVTVTNTVTRLKRAGLLRSEPYRSIFLTTEGKELAEAVRARHELVLDFLSALGVPAKDAEADAEGIEHHLSPATLDAMRRFLKRSR